MSGVFQKNTGLKRGFKVAISYPPLEGGPGTPLLSQNRQFQWFNSPTYIYPVVPAYAATLLKANGFEVLWDDAIAQGLSWEQWLRSIKDSMPDLVVIETKTPVVRRHWEIIKELKTLKHGSWRPLVAVVGDHVTALPSESMANSPADFVITGGDYDFLILELCKALKSGALAQGISSLPPGIWLRSKGEVKNTGAFKLDHDLDALPFIDRELTKWALYSRKNGNFKRLPGTYTMAGRDCWWSRCTFCSWTTLYPRYRVRRPDSLLDEIGGLIERYGIREVMDDTGTFPTGEWLKRFSKGMIERGYSKKISINCNMRFGALKKDDYRLMKQAGFRLLLFGLESANPATLARLNKGVRVDEIIESCRYAREAGLFPHITIMFGYPWESYVEALNTIKLGRWLLKKGLAWTVQATIVIPYPGTPLYEYCETEDLLLTRNWDEFDMRSPVIKTSYEVHEAMGLVKKIYSTAFSPEFLLRRFLAMRDADDLKYFIRAGGKVAGHLFDFMGSRKGRLKEKTGC